MVSAVPEKYSVQVMFNVLTKRKCKFTMRFIKIRLNISLIFIVNSLRTNQMYTKVMWSIRTADFVIKINY